jgi:putative ABC transport system permease protein
MSQATKVSSRPRRLPGLPGLHLPSITARAWADRGSLLLAGLVVALATLLTSAVPPALRTTADHAVADAVRRAGPDADVVVGAPFEREENLAAWRTRDPGSAAALEESSGIARFRLGPGLAAVLLPPVASVTSPVVKVTDGSLLRTFQLAYVADGAGPRVVWTAGGPPKSSVPEGDVEGPGLLDDKAWPVQVGLSEQNAAALGLGPGDRVPIKDNQLRVKDVRVSGVFRAVDPDDAAWLIAPQLLRPVLGADGEGTRRLAGLLSPDSLPDARLAFDEGQVQGTITFTPDPNKLTWHDAEALAAKLVALKASSGSSSGLDTSLKWQTGLDAVLQDVRAQVAAASAQASVLLIGLIATAALVLLLAADLLVRRRAVVLAGVRRRGASLAGIGAELVIESSAVALAGAALGMLLSRAIAGGASWQWPVPVVLVAVLGGPVLGMREATRATRGRQPPANRSARRSLLRTAQLRRVALEVAVVLAAAGAFVALRQRGVLPTGPDDDAGLALPATAPTLGAAVAGLVLLRLLPPGVDLVLIRAVRSRRSLALFGAARAAATAARPLPFLALIMSSALLTFALAVSTTESRGQADGAWRSVGADARLDVTPSESVTALAQRVSTSNGVRQAVAARVSDNVPVLTGTTRTYARLVVVDAAAFSRLLAGTPLPDAPQLSRLKPAGGPVPALLRSADGVLRPGKGLAVRWNDTTIGLTAVGTAPAVGDGEGNIVIVDASAFAAAGAVATANTVWVLGPGATQAVTAVRGSGDVTVRQEVLAARRAAPLAAGLLHLAYASAGVLLLLGLLGVALGAAASAPGRGETLARLRTLGLRPRESRQVAAGELLPPVVVGVLGGLAIGVLLAHASLGLLALRMLTGQSTDPVLVVPWVTLAVVAVLFVASVGGVVAVESSLRRRERLGEVLRAGTST